MEESTRDAQGSAGAGAERGPEAGAPEDAAPAQRPARGRRAASAAAGAAVVGGVAAGTAAAAGFFDRDDGDGDAGADGDRGDRDDREDRPAAGDAGPDAGGGAGGAGGASAPDAGDGATRPARVVDVFDEIAGGPAAFSPAAAESDPRSATGAVDAETLAADGAPSPAPAPGAGERSGIDPAPPIAMRRVANGEGSDGGTGAPPAGASDPVEGVREQLRARLAQWQPPKFADADDVDDLRDDLNGLIDRFAPLGEQSLDDAAAELQLRIEGRIAQFTAEERIEKLEEEERREDAQQHTDLVEQQAFGKFQQALSSYVREWEPQWSVFDETELGMDLRVRVMSLITAANFDPERPLRAQQEMLETQVKSELRAWQNLQYREHYDARLADINARLAQVRGDDAAAAAAALQAEKQLLDQLYSDYLSRGELADPEAEAALDAALAPLPPPPVYEGTLGAGVDDLSGRALGDAVAARGAALVDTFGDAPSTIGDEPLATKAMSYTGGGDAAAASTGRADLDDDVLGAGAVAGLAATSAPVAAAVDGPESAFDAVAVPVPDLPGDDADALGDAPFAGALFADDPLAAGDYTPAGFDPIDAGTDLGGGPESDGLSEL